MKRDHYSKSMESDTHSPHKIERHSVTLSLLRPGVKHTWREDKLDLPGLCSSGVGWPVELRVCQPPDILKANSPCSKELQVTA